MQNDFDFEYEQQWIANNSKLVGLIYSIMRRGLKPIKKISEVNVPVEKPEAANVAVARFNYL